MNNIFLDLLLILISVGSIFFFYFIFYPILKNWYLKKHEINPDYVCDICNIDFNFIKHIKVNNKYYKLCDDDFDLINKIVNDYSDLIIHFETKKPYLDSDIKIKKDKKDK